MAVFINESDVTPVRIKISVEWQHRDLVSVVARIEGTTERQHLAYISTDGRILVRRLFGPIAAELNLKDGQAMAIQIETDKVQD